MVQQGRVERGDRRFLPPVLGSGAGEYAGDLADQCAFHPQLAGLIQKIAHLGGHVAEPGRRAKDDRVVISQFFGGCDGSLLVQLHAHGTSSIFGNDFRHALDHLLHAVHHAHSFGYGFRHSFDMPIHAVIQDEYFCHGRPPVVESFRDQAVYIGGFLPPLPTWMRCAVRLPSSACCVMMTTCAPALSTDLSAGLKVTMGTPCGTMIFWLPPL